MTPGTEEHPVNAQSAYATFCALPERMVYAFYHKHGLPFTILRVGNPYCPLKRPNKDQGLIDHFIHSAKTVALLRSSGME
jgi:nucleoside-diphosphate-sugar epimerase